LCVIDIVVFGQFCSGKLYFGKASAGKLVTGLFRSLLLPCSFLALQSTAQAQSLAGACGAPADLSSLSGVWNATSSRVSRGQNAGSQSSTLNLQVDVNGHVKGMRSWKSLEYGFNAAGNTVNLDAETVTGLFDRATCRMVLVETVEAGTIQADLKPDGSLPYVLTQPGRDPVVVMGVYRR